MNCIFDICELYNGILLGIFASIIASIIVLTISKARTKKQLRSKYGKFEGYYKGYGYQDNQDLQLSSEHQSEAIITYLKDNYLKIELANDFKNIKYKWSGIIIMELENYGSLSWSYEIYNSLETGDYQHKFGFKRIIAKEDNRKYYIYLTEENLESGERYQREVLIREK